MLRKLERHTRSLCASEFLRFAWLTVGVVFGCALVATIYLASEAVAVVDVHVTEVPGFPLGWTVEVELSHAGAARLRWAADDGSTGAGLETDWTSGTRQAHSLRVFRLRPCTRYRLSLYTRSSSWLRSGRGSLQREVLIRSGCTGLAAFDDGPLAEVSGAPSFDLLVTDHNRAGFHGFIALDDAGWVVWYKNYTQMEFMSDGDVPAHAFDQLPGDASHDMILLTQGTVQAQQVGVDGAVVRAHAGAEEAHCGLGLSHEAVVDARGAGHPVLTLQNQLVAVAGMKKTQIAQAVVEWDREVRRREPACALNDSR